MFYRTPEAVYRFSELDQFPWLEHGFGTRHSAPPDNLATVTQIHSADVLVADGRTGVLGPADAIVGHGSPMLLGIKTADCLPILLVDPVNRAIGAVHAGWRGTVAKIADKAIRKMCERFGSDPGKMHAAMGPGIGSCCFEIGNEVAEQFGEYANAVLNRKPRPHLDLSKVNHRQLQLAGVPTSQIYDSGQCTMCRVDDFYSHRKEKEQAGRMVTFVGIRGNT